MINQQKNKTSSLITLTLSLFLILPTQLLAEATVYSTQEGPVYYSGEAYPFYYSNTLHIPRIDTHNQPGLYQRAMLQFDPTIDAWRLEGVDTLSVANDRIKQVDLIITESLPVQAYLQIRGRFYSACGDFPIISDRQNAKRFEVTVAFDKKRFPEETPCTAEESLIFHPLQVYGLAAGTYEYVINGTYTGSFELKSDNLMPPSLMKLPTAN